MESAFTYIGNLVGAFEDVGYANRPKENNGTTSGCQPNCDLDITSSAEDYSFDNDDLELQGRLHESLGCFEDEGCGDDDYDNDRIKHLKSNRAGRTGYHKHMESLKSKSQEIASRMSLLQSFSGLSSNENDISKDPPDVSKSRSSLSNKTKQTDDDVNNDGSDFSWANSLSSNDGDTANDRNRTRREYTKGHRHYLPPPPKHLEWFAHGVNWTCMAIGFGWLGFVLSFMARQSPDFVLLREPMYLDPRYETIQTVGMLQFELCFNETHIDILNELNGNAFLLEPGQEPRQKPRTRQSDSAAADLIEVDGFGPSIVETTTTPCIIHKVDSDDVHDDVMYEVSRSVAFLALLLGAFSTICLTSSVFWKSINLRPIGAGYLITYFLQSFTFLIFDSNLCGDHYGCRMSQGGTYSAIASVCWLLACAASARMDSRKFRNQQKGMELDERNYFQEKSALYPMRPNTITIEKQHYRNAVQAELVREWVQEQTRKEQEEQAKVTYESRMAKATEVNGKTGNTHVSPIENNGQNLEELKKINTPPIYIPTLPETYLNQVIPVLPETQPSSSTSLKKKTKKPRSTSSVTKKEKSTRNLEIEGTKKPRSKKPKSKQKTDADLEDGQPIKPRSKKLKSKSKSENKNDGYIGDQGLIMSQTSFASTSASTKDEKKKKQKSSKKKKIEGKIQSEGVFDQDTLEERPRSSRKSKKDDTGKKEKKNSTRRSSKKIDDTFEHDLMKLSSDSSSSPEEAMINATVDKAEKNPARTKKRTSSRPRKSKKDIKPEKAEPLRDSVRKAVEEGQHYEL